MTKKNKKKHRAAITQTIAQAEKKNSLLMLLKQPINKLLFRFLLFMIVFYALWSTPFFQNYFIGPISDMYASISGFILNILGFGVTVNGDTIGDKNFAISIKNGCDGVEGLAIFIFAVIIYPTLWKNKFKGLLGGILFLVALNFLRIISLYLIGIYLPTAFDIMHESVWQIFFILFTIVALFYWIINLPINAPTS